MKELLLKLKACGPAIDWAGDKTIEEIWETCHRGDWMLWLARKLNIDKRVLTIAKARRLTNDKTARHGVTPVPCFNHRKNKRMEYEQRTNQCRKRPSGAGSGV